MKHEEIRELTALYALDALGPDEARAVEAHLEEGCPECAEELAELRKVTAGLAVSVPRVEPSPAVKADLMARVAVTRPMRPGRRLVYRAPRVWIPAAAAAMVMALLGWQTITLRQAVDQQHAQITALSDQLESQQELTRLIASAAAQIIELAGTEARPAANARVLWDTSAQVWHFFVTNLAPLAEDQTYQLWFVTGGEPRSAGTFRTDETGTAHLRVDLPADLIGVAAAAVSLEPAGGVPQPTGPVVLLGTV